MLYLPQQLTHCLVSESKTLERNSIIYSQGERTQVFYFLQSGLVGLYHGLENGKETLIRLYHAKQYFGFRTLFSDTTYHCSARVLQEAVVTRIQPTSQARFIADNSQF